MVRSAGTLFVALALLAPALVSAQEKPGELWITLVGTDYAKPYLEGGEYDDHEFLNNGTKLVIRISDIETEHTFTIKPHDDSLAPMDVTTIAKKFKPKRVRGQRARRLVQTFKLKFEKKKAAPPEKPAPKEEPPAKDEPAPTKDAPKPDAPTPDAPKPDAPK